MSRRLGLVVAMCACVPSLAYALAISALPDGMCALDEKVPEQAAIVNHLRSANAGSSELITSFASCDELKAIAQKKATSVSHYGAVLQQAKPADLTMDRPTYLAAVARTYAQTGAALTNTAVNELSAASAQGTTASGVSNPSGISAVSKGVLYQDPRMVIIGVEQTNQFDAQATKIASTAGMTMIKGAPVSVNFYAPLTDPDSFTAATELLKPFINRMARENQ